MRTRGGNGRRILCGCSLLRFYTLIVSLYKVAQRIYSTVFFWLVFKVWTEGKILTCCCPGEYVTCYLFYVSPRWVYIFFSAWYFHFLSIYILFLPLVFFFILLSHLRPVYLFFISCFIISFPFSLLLLSPIIHFISFHLFILTNPQLYYNRLNVFLPLTQPLLYYYNYASSTAQNRYLKTS